MKDKRKFILEMNQGGELIQDSLHRHTINKYKPDSFILKSPVSYFLMIACVVIDIAFFRSLFVKISYDSPMMIILETAGLAFAADIVAAYAGILAKRIKQGLSRDKLNLYLLISVPIFALLNNGILRFATNGAGFHRWNDRCSDYCTDNYRNCYSYIHINRELCNQFSVL